MYVMCYVFCYAYEQFFNHLLRKTFWCLQKYAVYHVSLAVFLLLVYDTCNLPDYLSPRYFSERRRA